MRAAIKSVYPNATWAAKVAKMYDMQVIAIYYKFERDGKFDKPKKEQATGQLTVFDFV